MLKIKEHQIAPLIDRLTNLSMTSPDPSIPSTALRTIVLNLPRPSLSAASSAAAAGATVVPAKPYPSGTTTKPTTAVAPECGPLPAAVAAAILAVQRTLIPKLLVLLKPVSSPGSVGPAAAKSAAATLDSVDLLIETVRCFGQVLAGAEVERLQVAVMALIEHQRTSAVVKKRAVSALSLLCVHAPDELLSSFINHLADSLRAQSPRPNNLVRLRLLVSIAGALARAIPGRFGPHLDVLCPFVLAVVDGRDLAAQDPADDHDAETDEVREAALVALDAFQSCCTAHMMPFTDHLINSALLFLKYDPNYDTDSFGVPGHDQEMGGTQTSNQDYGSGNDGGDDDDNDGDHKFDGDDDNDEDGDDGDGDGGGDDDDEGAFEDDGDFSDEDDMSWKVRRCAAKLLATLLVTRTADLIPSTDEGGGLAYRRVAPALVDRFHEREENVRLEVLATATVLVAKTGEIADAASGSAGGAGHGASASTGMAPPPPKSRRGSDASMMDHGAAAPTLPPPPPPPPPSTEVPTSDSRGVCTSLTLLVPRISRSIGKLLNNKAITLPTKQASITLLASIASVLRGAFEGTLGVFAGALLDAARGGGALASGGNVVAAAAPGGSAATATGVSLRIEALRLFAKIFESHRAAAVRPFLTPAVAAVCAAVAEPGYKVSHAGLGTVPALVRLLTSADPPSPPPPPAQTPLSADGELLTGLHAAVRAKADNADTDLEVREKAILMLGLLLARTAGRPDALALPTRHQSLDVLLERLRNETTRMSAARAIESIAKSAADADGVADAWVTSVVAELSSQLRKANRLLRAVSLEALRSIAASPVLLRKLPMAAKTELAAELTPLLVIGDMQLLALAIAVVRLMVQPAPPTSHGEPSPDSLAGISLDEHAAIVTNLCGLVKSQLVSGVVLENLLALVATVGVHDQPGKRTLMKALLKNVGVTGDANVVAKVVAQLLVSGGGDGGGFAVSVGDFVDEVECVFDARRRCLALMVLGEVGLRMGPAFPVSPDSFLAHLSMPAPASVSQNESDSSQPPTQPPAAEQQQQQKQQQHVPLAAAVALGLAGAGNVPVFVPAVMQRLASGGDRYLLVHALKEVLTHAPPAALQPYAADMWTALLSSAVASNTAKPVVAECVGRLVVLAPHSFLPTLESLLGSPEPAVRATVVSALRYTFSDSDATYDALLRPSVVALLQAMLSDTELENRRLALTALNSAATNKPHLLAGPALERLLPVVYAESQVKPSLVREIQMGPFRHRVDDGLELRKSAYETLYALLETSLLPSLALPVYFERAIAGIADEPDIRSLACLLLARLALLARRETALRLGDIADAMKRVLAEKPKPSAVKQEIERHAEGVRGLVKVAVVLQHQVVSSAASANGGGVGSAATHGGGGAGSGGVAGSTRWRQFWAWVNQTFDDMVADVVNEEGRMH